MRLAILTVSTAGAAGKRKDTSGDAIAEWARERTYEIAADPTKPFAPPKIEEPVPYLNFAPLQNAIAKLHRSAREYQRVAGSVPKPSSSRALATLPARRMPR